MTRRVGDQDHGHGGGRRLLRSVLYQQRRAAAASIAAGLAWQGVRIVGPWVLERAVDHGVIAGDRAALVRWCLVLVVLGGIGWAADAARHWYVERAGAEGAADLRQRLTTRVLTMSDDDVAAVGHGDLGSRMVSDTWTVWLWLSGVATLVTSAFTLAAVSALLVLLDPVLAVIGLGAVPLAAALALGSARRHRALAADAADAAGGYGAAAEAALSGVRTIKGLGAERVALGHAARASVRLTQASLRRERLEAWWTTSAAAIPTLAIAAGVWFGGNRVLDGTTTVGALLAFVAWMALLVGSTTTLTHRLATRGAALAAADRLTAILGADLGLRTEPHRRRTPADDDPTVATSTPAADRREGQAAAGSAIVCRDVAVRRGGRDVLGHVDLELRAGTWTALAGPIGGGKSSLLRILAGLDAPAAGSVRVGGLDPCTLQPHERSGRVVLVPQAPMLVSGTVADVLNAGAHPAGPDELWQAIDAADARDTVQGLGGLEGAIGDRGMSLSGGQRQRLALAAALLRRPRVLLLDDPTSALDEPTERRVLQRMRDLLPATTVVVATHRAAAAAACDAVFAVGGGGVRADAGRAAAAPDASPVPERPGVRPVGPP